MEAVEEDEHGEIWHHTLKPLLAGTEVSAEIDWPRRLDHIQQHSGQHLLSAAFARDYRAQCAQVPGQLGPCLAMLPWPCLEASKV